MSLTRESVESLKRQLVGYKFSACDELLELSQKRQRLGRFIESPVFQDVPSDEQRRMLKQLSIMVEYIRILEERVEHFEVIEK